MKTNLKCIFAALILVVLFQNCSKVSFDEPQVQASPGAQGTSGLPGTPVGTLPSTGQIQQALTTCASAANTSRLQEQESPIFFDNPLNEVGAAPVCAWNQNGNGSVLNGYMTARYEQGRNVTVPAGAIICNVDFIFNAQAMEYDDTFFFTVNDFVLASNDDYWQNNHFRQGALPVNATQSVLVSQYDWSRLVSQPNSTKASKPPGTDFCLGSKEGLSQCSWPRTQVAGTIAMSVGSQIMTALGLTLRNGQLKFNFVTTGDDDPSSDCQHEPLSMRIKVRYVIP